MIVVCFDEVLCVVLVNSMVADMKLLVILREVCWGMKRGYAL